MAPPVLPRPRARGGNARNRDALRPQPDGVPPHRGRPHRPLQLAVRPPPRGNVHPAHRGYRPGAVDTGIGRGDPRRDGMAGAERGRGAPFVLRLRAPRAGTTVVHDLLRGDIAYEYEELDDLVLLRSDGSPTYNFVVVVDDATMGSTHVLRGADHLNNTPKQLLLYEALRTPLPRFGHL